ncbi:peptidase M61 [Pedobacter sp. MC2016-14]|uniref:M61 family metallopeptidase n=1 Tax=Pedobacter sp. MC2016-14 TaxID=2897327 RepID=UPI001E56DD04|nr:peptidase M61 [Pedobacter sp. MC2016-14]MCD0486736.1 peptidase M61 [Pedobacter sp. MC2016-14]
MKNAILGIITLLAVSMTAKSQVKIGFEVSFKEPQAHYAEIEMNISGLSKDYIDVKMPVWTPGSYLVREFSKSVEGFAASAGDKALKYEKVRKNTWRIYSAKAASVKVKYRIYGFEISVRTPFIDDAHAFLSTSAVFMYPDGHLKTPSTVKIIPFNGWTKVSTGLEPVAGQQFTYTAPDFDILFDSPIEVGNQEVFDFMAAGVKHEVAMYGGGTYNVERLKVDMKKVIEQETAIYGENPNQHYTFIVHNYASGGGGLEHLNSTVLGAGRDQYSTEEGYIGFLQLVAHEYHHLWNVKRLRPVALGPFDYENENYTTNLWIAEGFTAYYENKIMLRAGFNQPEGFVSEVATALANVENTTGSRIQSVAEASFDAWIKYYRPNENSSNTTVSYYSKGEVVGLLMDLEIANATKGAKSLDDVMKAMYLQCKTLKRGYTDAEFKTMVEKISGINFDDFYAKYVNGTAPVDYVKYFGYAGINITNENTGKKFEETPYLGASFAQKGGAIVVSAVSRNSAAWIGGLNVNDELLSLGNNAVDPRANSLPPMNGKVGEMFKVIVKRDGNIKELSLLLKASPNIKLSTTFNEKATATQLAVRKAWMGI